MKKVILCFLLFVCLFYSCKNTPYSTNGKDGEIERIDINVNRVKDSSERMFTDFDLIELETNDNCLLEGIIKVVFVKEYIYILTSYGGNIYTFDSNGRYVTKLTQGSGPGELVFATDFYVDTEKERLFVLDIYRKIKEYTLLGDYIDVQELNSPFFSLSIKKQDVFLFDPNLGKKTDHHLLISSSTGMVSSLLPKEEEFKQVGFMPANAFVDNGVESMYISHMLTDTIYEYVYRDKKLSPAYYVDFHDLSVNSNKIRMNSPQMYEKVCRENGYIAGIHHLMVLGDDLFFSFKYKDIVYTVYDRKEKVVALYSCLLENLPNPSRIAGKNDEGAVGVYNIVDIKDYFEKNECVGEKANALKKLSYDDDRNPILIIMKH